MKLVQLPSRHFKEGGKFKIEYAVRLEDWDKKFTKIPVLLEKEFGEGVPVSVSEDGKVIKWVDTTPNRAVRYTDEELGYILGGCTFPKFM
jgi:hypothetical protein